EPAGGPACCTRSLHDALPIYSSWRRRDRKAYPDRRRGSPGRPIMRRARTTRGSGPSVATSGAPAVAERTDSRRSFAASVMAQTVHRFNSACKLRATMLEYLREIHPLLPTLTGLAAVALAAFVADVLVRRVL